MRAQRRRNASESSYAFVINFIHAYRLLELWPAIASVLPLSSSLLSQFNEGVGLRSPAVPAQGLFLTDRHPDVRHNAPYPPPFNGISNTTNLKEVTPRLSQSHPAIGIHERAHAWRGRRGIVV